MKTKSFLMLMTLGGALLFTSSCKDDTEDPPPPPPGPGESTTELKVAKFTAAPEMDGTIDDMWANAQKLVGTVSVPNLAARGTYLNSDGEGTEEDLGLFYPYSGNENDFTMRAGYKGDRIYFLLEWVDGEDSKDRVSWYFDETSHLWKSEHKYANAVNDEFYEDKFAMLFPIGEVDGFSTSTCYATCHGPSLPVVTAKDKHTRHYLNGLDEKVDMWHWKRVRGTYMGQIDDQQMVYDDVMEGSGANGRKGDDTGQSGYANNSQTLNNGDVDVSVPLYIVPNGTDYYWISQDDFGGTAKLITGVDQMGVLTLEGGATIDPNGDAGFAHATGNKRVPSVTTRPFTEGRADIDISAVHTGTGWVCEFTRLLDTGDGDDVVFDITAELDFGLAIFDNAAIAHGIKPGLKLNFVQ